MTRFLICAVSLLIIAVPASAEQDVTGAATAATPDAAASKKICKSFGVTGRRISKRVCYTAAQWDELNRVRAEAAQKLVNDVSSAGAKGNLSSGGSGALSTGSLFGLGQ